MLKASVENEGSRCLVQDFVLSMGEEGKGGCLAIG